MIVQSSLYRACQISDTGWWPSESYYQLPDWSLVNMQVNFLCYMYYIASFPGHSQILSCSRVAWEWDYIYTPTITRCTYSQCMPRARILLTFEPTRDITVSRRGTSTVGLSRRGWSPLKIGPPGPSVAEYMVPPDRISQPYLDPPCRGWSHPCHGVPSECRGWEVAQEGWSWLYGQP